MSGEVIDADTGEILTSAPGPMPATPVVPVPGAISKEQRTAADRDVLEQPLFTRTMSGALAPVNEPAVKWMKSLLPGQMVCGKWKRVRNGKFHRKFFALLNLGFQYWEPADRDAKGRPVAKSFKRFRHDVMILSGHYIIVACLDGSQRLEPESISFANMDDEQFEAVYRDVFNVIWDMVCSTRFRDREQLNTVLNQVLSFE